MFLENETWELCPVKSNFNIAQLHVSKNHISEAARKEAGLLLHVIPSQIVLEGFSLHSHELLLKNNNLNSRVDQLQIPRKDVLGT